MPVFSKLTTTLSAVLALSSTIVYAAPLQPAAVPDHNYKLSTHRRHVGANNVEFVSYHPPSSYKTFHEGDHSLLSRSANATHSLLSRSPAGPSGVSPEVEEAAILYLSEQTGLAKDSLQVRSGHTNDIGVTHVYLHQLFNGIPVTNGVANVSFDKDGKVAAFGSNMVKPGTHGDHGARSKARLTTGAFSHADQISPATPALPETVAIQSAVASLGIPYYDDIPVTLSYVLQPAPSGTDPNRKWAMLTHQFQLRNEDASKWVQAHVDATNPSQGEVIHVVDFVAHASYRALDWSKQDPTWGNGFTMIENPEDKIASPEGWHTSADTRGNNVISYFGRPSSFSTGRPTGQNEKGLVFDYPWNPNLDPAVPPNVNVALVNAFYATNKYHDVLYRYGFTEAAYNFQNNNYGRGGAGNDWVQMQVQAPDGVNNAFFATPPDMYRWTRTTPNRDGDLQNDIITHELTHGLTNRLTGGGSARCLQTLESAGMGEGWSDTLAFWSEQTSTTPVDFTTGSWVTNNPKGIRRFPYSTSTKTNPYTYSTITRMNEVHDIGEVWATILVEVYWALVTARGFSAEKANPDQTAGNIIFLHLLVDGLQLQPCNPSFINSRNAIVQADARRYGSANLCILWRAFAKRGMGVNAQSYRDDFGVPQGC
ncbi:hypothetical protein FRC01_006247 [Tulasnella sp. 417]|nr:hypothetical protein FRC01_006247 [Tulasnella sp. 417]